MSVWPGWEVREAGGATSWFHVRLGFVDGARVELLAVVCEGCVSVEDVRAQPPLSLVDLRMLADWIEGPLFERCDQGGALEVAGVEGAGDAADTADTVGGHGGCDAEGAREPAVAVDADETFGPRRARQAWPRGIEGRWLAAQEYRAAQEEGADPVLAVMCATGHSRRRSLRLIAQARDAGYLTPRHARR
ncbi:DUF6214 family protein [Streptomyces sp. SLBN-115]|uniref:DUF6214 family protein n=1 Tax=Streptomyces sp. SLBN-115 TaxID=2768453 RepID=UPI00114E2FB1|nr:DUF6214 family protein [Streptomyces sp. SLBN-115]TQJ47247.1 hypothetical protein FBY34_6672 [Streptomyces sp. SLBN-115]